MENEASKSSQWKLETFTPVFLLLTAVPLAIMLWLGNVAFNIIKSGNDDVIPPTRWLMSTLAPMLVVSWGLKKKSLNKSGAIVGLFIGFILTLSNYGFMLSLIVMFITSSQATKFKSKLKKRLEVDHKEGGQRNWIQALCNGGMATQLALLYLLEAGSGERPIDFIQDYRSSWLALGVVGTIACANADTWASELGTVLSKSDPWLITTGRKVPKGVNGGVSLIGLLVSLVGGCVIGASYYLVVVYTADSKHIGESPPQWPIIPTSALAGLLGSVVDSVLGATLQYSGVDKKTGLVVEHVGPDVVYICGRRILDNHSVNLISTIITGLVTPRIANMIWPY
ncbi:transmembrane protein 19 isoform X2 [Cimex lectularius]|uniref:Transmembrane protein 19 n=2 Tax=Cimex lectularius TaxID=79782 RepID=A0A8I6REJ5_CIMLE|nr:transmembrane protein 19 isoform X2 [Cimex lectularius]